MDYDAEIRDLRRRVGELEGGFGFLSNQVRDVHRDLLGFRQAADQRFDQIDRRMEGFEGRMDGFETHMDRLESKIDALFPMLSLKLCAKLSAAAAPPHNRPVAG